MTGASGAGKTTAVERLAGRNLDDVFCAFLDSIGVPSADEMPDDWQETTTSEWVRRLTCHPSRLVILDGQTRPTFALQAFREIGVAGRVILFECSKDVRATRLAARGQPHLASHDMHAWGAYLRGQADALGLAVIDTSELDVDAMADALLALVRGA